METHIEHINRFVVERREKVSDMHAAQMRLNGIDPETRWELIWSFDTEEAARAQCEKDQIRHNKIYEQFSRPASMTYRVRYLGGSLEIKREVFF